ncbi:hypothetical protein ACH5RR_029932 [Cinchona calisaya]|uniref:Uncharacterized protein n=1 Tax=Cinchona calisaya TaxID=153742 RepID=A0ABD2YT37_9GENT
MSSFRRLRSPLIFSTHLRRAYVPSPRRSTDSKMILSPSRRWSIFLSFLKSARTAAISPFHNVREVAHESKCECPFHRERDGQLLSVLAPAVAPLEPSGVQNNRATALWGGVKWTIPYSSFRGASLPESILTPQLSQLTFDFRD